MKAIIYRIVLPCGGTYVGQTKKHRYQRWGGHLADLDKKRHFNKQMQESFDNNEVDDWKWEIIESIESDDKAYINLMERHYIMIESNVINEREKHANNEARNERYKERYKEAYIKNKDKILAKYHENKGEVRIPMTKEELKEYRKEYQREYREANKEYYKEYREANNEKIKEYQREYRQKIKS